MQISGLPFTATSSNHTEFVGPVMMRFQSVTNQNGATFTTYQASGWNYLSIYASRDDGNNYEVFKTPIPKDDPLNWTDSRTYKERLKSARKKTGMDCGMMVVSGLLSDIKVTAVASDFDFLGASMAAAEGEAFLYGIQYAIENKTPFLCISAGGGMRMMESLISLSQMTRTTLAINELKKNGLTKMV